MRSCIFFFVVQTVMVGYDFTTSSIGTSKKKKVFRDVQTNHLFKCSKWLKANACYQVNMLSTQYMKKKMRKHDLLKVRMSVRALFPSFHLKSMVPNQSTGVHVPLCFSF